MSDAPTWLVTAVVFVVSLALSGFFSGCETGCMSVSRARLMRGEGVDPGRRRRLEGMLRRVEEPILTCLIGTNLANVLGSAVVTVALTTRYPQHGQWYALAVVSTLVILLGEILPKVLFREYPERLMLGAQPALGASMTVTLPLRKVLGAYTGLWRRLLPGGQEGAELDRRNLAALLLTNSVPATDDRRFTVALDRFLQLEARQVAAFAKPLDTLVTVGPQSNVADCLAVAAASGFSRLPLRDGDGMPFYIRVRDLLFLDRDSRQRPVPRRMLHTPLVVDGRLSPYELFEEMRAQDRQLAMVAGPAGNLEGMITLEDLIETVVGSIADEFDPPATETERTIP